jgi:hypothetical protein
MIGTLAALVVVMGGGSALGAFLRRKRTGLAP